MNDDARVRWAVWLPLAESWVTHWINDDSFRTTVDWTQRHLFESRAKALAEVWRRRSLDEQAKLVRVTRVSLMERLDRHLDTRRLDWLSLDTTRLEDVRGRMNNHEENLREAIDELRGNST